MRVARKKDPSPDPSPVAHRPDRVKQSVRGLERLAAIAASVRRERDRILDAALQVGGLMPLLMKQRNGQHWTRGERTELRQLLRRLPGVSLGIKLRAVPGAMLPLPLVAWWLERRRRRQKMRRPLR